MQDQVLAGRYRLVRHLGEGGMGEVWEAHDETLDRPVAVKVISLLAGGGSRGGEARARFLREARITARLQHPHVVTVHDLGESSTENGTAPFLVMELVRGEGLDAKLRQGAISLDEAAGWGVQICEALADAHEAGFMHRDIKPSNILITLNGEVKVLDFGVARAADPCASGDRLTRTGFIVGTPPYMAPEQARGHPVPSSDLYALGCLLFELITGRLPFRAPDPVGYLSAHLTQEPPRPSSLAPDIPAAWDDLVLTLLRKEPDQRYPHATGLAQALRQLNAGPRRTAPADDIEPGPAPDGTRLPPTRLVSGPSSTDALPAAKEAAPEEPDGRPEAVPATTVRLYWSGKDPLPTYTDATTKSALIRWCAFALVLALPATFLPLLLHRIKPPGSGQDDGWMALFVVSGLCALFALITVLIYLPVLTFLHRTAGWSLKVGPQGIETVSAAGRHELRWSDLDRVSIAEIDGRVKFFSGKIHLHRYAGIHVKLVKGAKRAHARPAGWPTLYPGNIVARQDKMVPVCVLGPMTDQQRAELKDALSTYSRP
ncbi:protein kinase [Streptomyces sp. NPDC056121]|uniref:serine/threonine-protein kinase n=1 Tax=Streptomyces sp. NPDC056121 TaxID=3345718 RepID=UPI0035DD9C46